MTWCGSSGHWTDAVGGETRSGRDAATDGSDVDRVNGDGAALFCAGRTDLGAGALAPVRLLLLLHCGGDVEASRDGGPQSDATAGGPARGGGSASSGPTDTCGDSGRLARWMRRGAALRRRVAVRGRKPLRGDGERNDADGQWCSIRPGRRRFPTWSRVFVLNDVSTLLPVTEGTNTCTCFHWGRRLRDVCDHRRQGHLRDEGRSHGP